MKGDGNIKTLRFIGTGYNNYHQANIKIYNDELIYEGTTYNDYGILATKKLTIKGSGTLNASGYYGIFANNDLTIEDGVIDATSTSAVDNNGMGTAGTAAHG